MGIGSSRIAPGTAERRSPSFFVIRIVDYRGTYAIRRSPAGRAMRHSNLVDAGPPGRPEDLVGEERTAAVESLLTAADAAARSGLERSVFDLATDTFGEAQSLERAGDHEGARAKLDWVEVYCNDIIEDRVDVPQSAAWRFTADEQKRMSDLIAEGAESGKARARVMSSISPKERAARSRASWHSAQRRMTLMRVKAVRGRFAPLVRSVRPVPRPRQYRRRTTRTSRGSPARPSGDGPEPPPEVVLLASRPGGLIGADGRRS